ncbi:hypothetical protein J7M23_12155 [Candidatus Sumerlaeota bacterium]|nr:hypothetical protein [Candidatus Sumerlaeota bacterium]
MRKKFSLPPTKYRKDLPFTAIRSPLPLTALFRVNPCGSVADFIFFYFVSLRVLRGCYSHSTEVNKI